MIDETDRTILTILQQNARTSNAEIARRVGLAPSAVFERIRRLEERAVIRGYHADVDPAAVDRGLIAFVSIGAGERSFEGTVGRALAALPAVQEVHHVAGDDCYLIKARVADIAALSALLRDGIGAIPQVRSTRTTIVLGTDKESALPAIDGD